MSPHLHSARDMELDALAQMAENWHPNFAERQGIRPRRQIVGAFMPPRAERPSASGDDRTARATATRQPHR